MFYFLAPLFFCLRNIWRDHETLFEASAHRQSAPSPGLGWDTTFSRVKLFTKACFILQWVWTRLLSDGSQGSPHSWSLGTLASAEGFFLCVPAPLSGGWCVMGGFTTTGHSSNPHEECARNPFLPQLKN